VPTVPGREPRNWIEAAIVVDSANEFRTHIGRRQHTHYRGEQVAAAALLAKSTPTHASGAHTAMDDTPQLLALVDKLVEARPLTASATGRLVRATLAPVGELSTERKLVYAAQEAAGFTRVELRLPGPRSTDNGQFLLLQLADGPHCVTMAQVQARHGQGALSVPTPREPADSPLFLRFERDWGTLSFGFARGGAECLRTVAIDVAPAK